MSAGVSVSSAELRKVFVDISPMFPTGSHTVPVLFQLVGTELRVACTTGCVYKAVITVPNPENENWEITVLYKNLVDFVANTGFVNIYCKAYGLELHGDGYDIQLAVGYSVVTWPEDLKVDYTPIQSTGYISGLRNLLNLGLDKIYAAEKPIHVYGSLSVLKYPNIQVQTRTHGLDLVAVMTPEHIKMLVRFEPDSYYTNGVDSVILRKKSTYLELPMDVQREQNQFTDLLDGMSEPVTLHTEGLLEKLRSMSKLNPTGRCKLILRDGGLDISLSSENTSITTKLGSPEGRVLSVLYLPMSLVLAMIRVAGGSLLQFLYKGDLLCLRTQSVIIVVRALV